MITIVRKGTSLNHGTVAKKSKQPYQTLVQKYTTVCCTDCEHRKGSIFSNGRWVEQLINVGQTF